jgi:NTP pyrophosphatase (non-canonical NTP hydrolase)
MSDQTTTLEELRNEIRDFVLQRDWRQFHSPKNLAMALAIEAAELMEHFQWLDIEASRGISRDQAKLAAVGEELADVFCYTLAMANELQIDLSAVMRAKMVKNIAKYPVDQYHGRFERDED